MKTNDKIDSAINQILKEAHKEIEPPDSWRALKARINRRIEVEKSIFGQATGSVIFWQRLAFSMAACFLITAGILLYFLRVNYGVQEYHQQ